MVGNLPAPPLDEEASGDIGYTSILPLVRTFIADAGGRAVAQKNTSLGYVTYKMSMLRVNPRQTYDTSACDI